MKPSTEQLLRLVLWLLRGVAAVYGLTLPARILLRPNTYPARYNTPALSSKRWLCQHHSSTRFK